MPVLIGIATWEPLEPSMPEQSIARRGRLHRRCLTRSRKRPQQKHPKTPVTP